MNPRNIFLHDKVPSKNKEELVETLCRDKNIHIERIISKGNTTPPGQWYDQEHNEWVILLQGSATLELKNKEKVNLSEGDYLLIPSRLKHRVSYTSEEPLCIWLAIHFSENTEIIKKHNNK